MGISGLGSAGWDGRGSFGLDPRWGGAGERENSAIRGEGGREIAAGEQGQPDRGRAGTAGERAREVGSRDGEREKEGMMSRPCRGGRRGKQEGQIRPCTVVG